MPVSENRVLVVKDANIVIDLLNADLLAPWFKLKIPTFTTDMVVSELKRGSQWVRIEPLIISGAFMVEIIQAKEIRHVIALKQEHNVSVPDGSVLHLAKIKGALLLTGDRKLRLAAKRSKIIVSGVLWMLDLMLVNAVITPAHAAKGLRLMLQQGARLPEREVAERLDDWESR